MRYKNKFIKYKLKAYIQRYNTRNSKVLIYCTIGWVDIGIGTKVPLGFVTYLSKVKKMNEKSVLTA
jgi:hypothetical protein